MSAELYVQLRVLSDKVQTDTQDAVEKAQRILGARTIGGGGVGGGGGAGGANQQDSHVQMYKRFERLANKKTSAIKKPEEDGQGIVAGFRQMAMSYIRFKVFSLAIQEATKAVGQLAESANRAGKIYASAMTSGLGISMTVRRGMLAGVMGVSEQEVVRFGAAIAYLQPKLRAAQDVLTKTTTPLTQVNWEFRVVLENLKALMASIAVNLAPALMKLGTAINYILEVINNSPSISKIISKVGAGEIGGGLFGPIGAYIGGKLGSMSASGAGGQMPSPQSYMKQMPASAWERMGLVLGGGGGTSYAKETAEATKKSAKFLEFLAKGHFNTSSPFAASIPSTP